MRNMYLDVDESMFRDFLRNARSSQFYRLNEEDIKDKVQRLKTLLVDVQRRISKIKTSTLFLDFKSCNSNFTFRCERSFKQSFEDDVFYLFLQYVYYDWDREVKHCRKRYLTTFVVKRNIFCAFFNDAKI